MVSLNIELCLLGYVMLLPHFKEQRNVLFNEEDITTTAFISKYGRFEYSTMPFGLCNALATFQRTMECALGGLQ